MKNEKKFLTLVVIWLLITFSNVAMAEWTQFPIDKNGEKIYVNKSERVRSGNIVSVIFLTEFEEPRTSRASNGKRYVRVEYISQKEDVVLDCSQQKFRIMKTIYFQLPMAKGKDYESHSIPTDWLAACLASPIKNNRKKPTNYYSEMIQLRLTNQ